MKYSKIIIPVLFWLAFANILLGQIRIKELPRFDLLKQDSLFLDASHSRNIISLDGTWSVYPKNSRDDRTLVSVPSNFRGEEELTFEKNIRLDSRQVKNSRLELVFLGLNYSAEITLNNFVIYKHSGGEFPFKVELPKNIVKPDQNNVFTVKVYHKLSSEATIPVNQRFLFPENVGGIFRDVYIEVSPFAQIINSDYSYYVSSSGGVSMSVNAKLANHSGEEKQDSTSAGAQYAFRVRLLTNGGEDILNSTSGVFYLGAQKEKAVNYSYSLTNVSLWSPDAPRSYRLRIQLLRNDQVIDEVEKPAAFYSLRPSDNSLLLNNAPFTLKGTTYYAVYPGYGNLVRFERMKSDMKAIKAMGFNAVRFAKELPAPYYLKLCQELGLLAFVELPLNSIPEEIAGNQEFKDRLRIYVTQFLNSYKQYSSVAAFGLGGSYLPDSPEEMSMLSSLAGYVKHFTNKMVYASFAGFNISPVSNLDFYGVELFNKPMAYYTSRYSDLEARLGKGKVFICSATYASFMGNTNGYSNSFSFEAQAKFFSDLIDFSSSAKTSGFFINSIFDFRGDYASLSAGFSPENVYNIGIMDEYRQSGRFSEKVIYSKLHNEEEVTIPQGSQKDDSPIIFIISGVVLVLILGFLINTRRKFREDATRALLRPYNFFADIRDMRLMSGMQSTALMIVLSLGSALLQSNVLYFFRTNILLEKIVLAFGSPRLSWFISFLAWNPAYALIWLTVVSMIFFVLTSITIKIASLFNRNKVFFSSIYFMVVWSFLPLVVLLPLGLFLYKVLNVDVMTFYLFIALVVFTLWIFHRLMKGIYVIFDVRPATVYMYTIGLMLLVSVCVLLYFQLSQSSVYFILNAYKQYKVM
ncbi:MAG: glycoside hydrolase family 2 TIM barrel-domain containing protein [Syntrophomonadaceae bacterium]